MDTGSHVIGDYANKPPFADFLPGIAGLTGVPAWCFFVNRGQGVVSFGTQDKDHPIMEFTPAHTAWQRAELLGFRSFVRHDGVVTELFGNACTDLTMRLQLNSLSVACRAGDIHVQVDYCILPNEPVGALMRQVILTNTGNRETLLELLDGMPALVPYGVNDWTLKNMVQTGRAWMETQQLETGVPRYRVRVSMEDSAYVKEISGCAFALSADDSGSRLPALVDAGLVFGQDTAFLHPQGFLTHSLAQLASSEQAVQNSFPCYFTGFTRTLAPGESAGLCTLIGHAGSDAQLDAFLQGTFDWEWFVQKQAQAQELALHLTDRAYIKTADPVFDAYTRQTYLDNCLRGGWPVQIGAHLLHPFSRKHGDLERDYNYFYLAPEPFSQGNGNFRDVIQNRRCEVSFSPFVGLDNIKSFVSLIQLDGYNPLQIDPESFVLDNQEKSPGALWQQDSKNFESMLSRAEKKLQATFCEGYWSDHWTYTLDLIEDFLRIWPERQRELLETKVGWFASKAVVLPRVRRYVETKNGLRQYHFLMPRQAPTWETDGMALLESTVLEKLIALCALKFAALDPWAMGIGMEGGKPSWYDALNGLPALTGSSVAESLELVRLLRFNSQALRFLGGSLQLLTCQAELIWKLKEALEQNRSQLMQDCCQYNFWCAANDGLETYRDRCFVPAWQRKTSLDSEFLAALLSDWADVLEKRLRLAHRPAGLMPTYFRYEVTRWKAEADGIMPTGFVQQDMPLFLEGTVHAMKLASTPQERRSLHQLVKNSELYDIPLEMYRVNVPLDKTQLELGRCAAFTPLCCFYSWLAGKRLHLAAYGV